MARRILFHCSFISRFAFTFASGPALTRYDNDQHSTKLENRASRHTFNKLRALSQSLEGVERPRDA